VAFLVPYAVVFLAFVVYPVAYALWMARDASLYADLLANPLYGRTVVKTTLFVGLGANVMMFLALLLSGFFMRRRWWIQALLPVFLLPWALPAIPAFVSFHWMLIGEEGLVDSLLAALFGIQGPLWFTDRGGAGGRRVPPPGVSPHLSAVDGAGIGGSRDFRAIAWNEYLYQSPGPGPRRSARTLPGCSPSPARCLPQDWP